MTLVKATILTLVTTDFHHLSCNEENIITLLQSHSQSPRYPVPLEKGNKGSGNEIDIATIVRLHFSDKRTKTKS